MIRNYVPKNSEIVNDGQKVKVYVNLHNGKIAIQDTKGRVMGYCDEITLTGVTFSVGEKTLLKVREKNCRAVFAYCKGIYTEEIAEQPQREVSFNPFKRDRFYFVNDGQEIEKTDHFAVAVAKAETKKIYL